MSITSIKYVLISTAAAEGSRKAFVTNARRTPHISSFLLFF
jgi:hypothetical protein